MDGHATSDDCGYKYRRMSGDAAASIRAEVLGSDVPNGYTTVAQADRIGATLGIRPGRRLLDLGGGRGWPGRRIAERTGCALVLADLPLEVLRAAEPLSAGSVVGRVCADGSVLPFRDASFAAVSHTDVLC